jgi:hypothetical protein
MSTGIKDVIFQTYLYVTFAYLLSFPSTLPDVAQSKSAHSSLYGETDFQNWV